MNEYEVNEKGKMKENNKKEPDSVLEQEGFRDNQVLLKCFFHRFF